MSLFLTILISLFFSILNAEEFKYKVVGKLKTDNVIDFPEGGKFVSFHHEGGFETDIGKYGEYQCRGSILYDKHEKLVNMFFACENFDQNGQKLLTWVRGSKVQI